MRAYLGTGLLGANFVKAMLKRGIEVQVWNRTYCKAYALEQYGAKAFEDIRQAVEGASIVHMTLKDDISVDEVLNKAKAALAPGVIIIDHTTTSSAGAAQRTESWKKRGVAYLHAPVFMSPQNALTATGYMLVSGNQELIRQVGPELSKMTGKLLNFGNMPGKAAGIKLIGNLFLIAFTAGLSDALTLAQAENISSDEVQMLFDAWNPAASSIPSRIKKMVENDFSTPSWELSMARKDTKLFMDSIKTKGFEFTVIPAIAKQMDDLINKGQGHQDWMIISNKNVKS